MTGGGFVEGNNYSELLIPVKTPLTEVPRVPTAATATTAIRATMRPYSTMVAPSSAEKGFSLKGGGNVAAAKEVGKRIAARAIEKGVRQVAMDRGGYRYHGRVKALADAARAAGLEF